MDKLEERFKSLEGDILDPKSVLHVDGLLVSSGDCIYTAVTTVGMGRGAPSYPLLSVRLLRETKTSHTLEEIGACHRKPLLSLHSHGMLAVNVL